MDKGVYEQILHKGQVGSFSYSWIVNKQTAVSQEKNNNQLLMTNAVMFQMKILGAALLLWIYNWLDIAMWFKV